MFNCFFGLSLYLAKNTPVFCTICTMLNCFLDLRAYLMYLIYIIQYSRLSYKTSHDVYMQFIFI